MNKSIKNLCIIVLCSLFSLGGLIALGSVRANDVDSSAQTEVGEIPKVSGTTYYVDAAADEGNDGLTPENALKTLEEVNQLQLKPGDQVLFKRGCKWNGGLVVAYSGTSEAPISYDAYGEDKQMPILDAHGMVTATIRGEDVSYIHVKNLEIMNTTDGEMGLRGISFTAMKADVEGIYIADNYVHDVESASTNTVTRGSYSVGAAYQDLHWNGGIVVRAGGYAARNDEQKILKDVLVENNRVEDTFIEGIVIGSVTKSWKKSLDIVVRNNYLTRCGGEGVAVFGSDGVLLEGNTCESCGQAAKDAYSNNYVGMMVIYCENVVIQYNEIFDQQPCKDDGQAIDADDTCKNVVIQYNYSHDNANGFLLLFNYNKNGHSVVRYNVSQNDGGPFVTFSCLNSSYPMVATSEIYNNTCFTNKQITEMIEIEPNSDMKAAESKRLVLEIENNIFASVGVTNLSVLNNDTYYEYMEFNNNCWYGFSERTLPKNEGNQIVGDPKLTYAGSASKGLDSAFGYKLLKDSPCLNTGKTIYNNGGLDFFGNKIGETVNVGAYMGEAAKLPKGVNVALNQKADMSSMQAIAMLKKATLAQLIDGSANENVATKATSNANEEAWYEIEFSDSYDITKVILKTGEDASLFPKDFAIEIWDGTQWKQVAKKNDFKIPEGETTFEFKFKETTGTKVRVLVTEMRENPEGQYAAQLSEIEVYQ